MGVRILGWGKWGEQVLKKISPISWVDAILPVREYQFNESGIFVDPLAAETWYSRPPFIDVEDMIRPVTHTHIKAGEVKEGFRVHIVHAADHFATGCISAFLRSKEDGCSDALVLFLPQLGVNESTVGRILAEIYGLQKFADITILIDASAPHFALVDEGSFVDEAVNIVRLLLCMERSVCGLQLLEQMAARTFSFSIQPIKIITEICSLEPLWQNCTVEKTFGIAPGSSWLSISVSNKRERYLPRIIMSNLDRKTTVHLPFLKKYEWKEASAYSEPFVGIFCADHIPAGIRSWFRSYYRHYFPYFAAPEEQSSIEIERWLRTHFIEQHWQPLTSAVIRNAIEFCKKKAFKKGGG